MHPPFSALAFFVLEFFPFALGILGLMRAVRTLEHMTEDDAFTFELTIFGQQLLLLPSGLLAVVDSKLLENL